MYQSHSRLFNLIALYGILFGAIYYNLNDLKLGDLLVFFFSPEIILGSTPIETPPTVALTMKAAIWLIGGGWLLAKFYQATCKKNKQIILRYFQSIASDVFLSHIHGGIHREYKKREHHLLYFGSS